MSIKDSYKNDDNILFENYEKGDLKSLVKLIDKYKNNLLALANSIIGFDSMGQDILQELFIKLSRRKKGDYNDKNIKGFLYVSMRNLCFTYLEKEKKRRQAYEYFNRYSGTHEEIRDFYDLSDCRKTITRLKDELTPVQYSIIKFRAYYNRKPNEIVRLTGIDKLKVNREFSRAKKKLDI